MNPNVIALLAFLGIFGAALLGMRIRTALPEHHLSQETKDTVRLGMGLVATMTALLLGLLIAAAKGSYDTQRSEVIPVDHSSRLAQIGSQTFSFPVTWLDPSRSFF